ncbi:MAG: amylo-alpha-1,6-glucosidase [Sedimentisphaeraceae bacterium JB056]
MQHNLNIKQTPAPDSNLLVNCGECITFTLSIPKDLHGNAYLRTNLGKASLRRMEIIRATETEGTLIGKDWWDIPMSRVSEGEYRLKVAVTETGWFAAKTLFIKPDGKVDWPAGKNVYIKVEPADTACNNTIYTVFPRQFGEMSKNFLYSQVKNHSGNMKELDNNGYIVIPPSGKFRDVIEELDFIIGHMNFNIIQLLPVHPVPTVFARMGRYGSPFASTDFFNVDPACASEVRDATPMEQFIELVDQVHMRLGKVFIDLPANHTGWASLLQIHHPDWFKRLEDKRFKSPGAWGVVWEDLCELDYTKTELQNFMTDVFLYWARQGVDGFRCDAGYMIPAEAWRFITAKVRNEFPDTIFMLEGLGGSLSITEELLSSSNLNWAYSELFQNYSAEQIVGYLNYCDNVSSTQGTMVHFAETHDNNRLAATSKTYAKMRTAMSALFSSAGAFGITNGVEWFAEEKVDVHEASGLNWGSEDNQVEAIRRLNILLKNHPCFEAGAQQKFVHSSGDQTMALLRKAGKESMKRWAAELRSPDGKILAVVNLNCEKKATVSWSEEEFRPQKDLELFDLLSGNKIDCWISDGQVYCELPEGAVYALVKDRLYFDILLEWEKIEGFNLSPAVYWRRLNTIVQQAIINVDGFVDFSGYDIQNLAKKFKKNPRAFFYEICHNDGYLPVISWDCAEDKEREVMLPPEHFLLVSAREHFLCELTDEDGQVVERAYSLKIDDGRHIAVLNSFEISQEYNTDYKLKVRLYKREGVEYIDGPVKVLAKSNDSVCIDISGSRLRHNDDYALCCNELGAIGQVRAKWGSIRSKYDAFLSANLNPDFPVDRHIMLTRLRGWVVYRDYSREISVECQSSFTTDMNNKVSWRFDLPVGMGKRIPFVITLDFSKTDNSAQIIFTRLAAHCEDCLDDGEIVKLIIRPDIEDRCSHCVTKAYEGPEFSFPKTIEPWDNGFAFNAENKRELTIKSDSDGKFINEPEWNYMVNLPVEYQRGLESSTDLFSPGYFKFKLGSGRSVVLNAEISIPGFEPAPIKTDLMSAQTDKKWNVKDLLAEAMKFYMVKRGRLKTIIAGYPWFLDWGRDTFISLRGFIAAGFTDECREIIGQFARFEENGTLPNMIRGDDVSNRDTTDAPLWMFTAVNDYISKTGDNSILLDDCDSRTLLEVLISIANGYIASTPNGIKVDPETMLVFSPPHFTWMDTNYPAATPREGYPIEIQALWFAALNLLGHYDKENGYKWLSLADQVSKSVARLYPSSDGIGLTDCLNARSGVSANIAQKDEILRPNQLFAITLGLIDDKNYAADIINACSKLIIPGSIRSLANRKIKNKMPVYNNGRLLNNPDNPYFGIYGGDEDMSRKPAYHNGTAWGWVYPSYCEAMVKIYGDYAKPAANSLMLSIYEMLKTGCIGHLPEICDGDYPHTQRGCQAQSWSVTEAYRILDLLEK